MPYQTALKTYLVALFALPALAVQGETPLIPNVPENVAARKVDIQSEGTRMTGYLYFAKAAPKDSKLPVVLMAHGWGGIQTQLREDAVEFAREGYLVLTFDYRGWGESDSRIVLKTAASDPKKIEFTAEVKAIREVVDPLDMTADWQNAIHWIHGEAQADKEHIGLWGSSMGGSYAVYAGAHDARVKAVHSQVTGGLKGALWAANPGTFTEATQRARGELGYPMPRAQVYPGLFGAPISSRFVNYNPLDDITNGNKTAYQFVLSEKEQYLNNEEHAIAAYKRYTGPKNLVIIPGISHYDVYSKARKQVHALALAWFDKYLKSTSKQQNAPSAKLVQKRCKIRAFRFNPSCYLKPRLR